MGIRKRRENLVQRREIGETVLKQNLENLGFENK